MNQERGTRVARGGVLRGRTLLALFPLIFTLFACGSLSSLPAGSPVPPGLTGQWQTTLGYIPAFYAGTVPVQDSNGVLGIFFYFWPDGRYEFVLNSTLSYYNGNCFRTTRWDEFGTVRISGSQFTFTPSPASYVVTDSCGQSLAKRVPGDPATLTMTSSQDQTGWPLLRMTLPSGEVIVLEKCRTCK